MRVSEWNLVGCWGRWDDGRRLQVCDSDGVWGMVVICCDAGGRPLGHAMGIATRLKKCNVSSENIQVHDAQLALEKSCQLQQKQPFQCDIWPVNLTRSNSFLPSLQSLLTCTHIFRSSTRGCQ